MSASAASSSAHSQRRECFIVSEMNGKVLDIKKGQTTSGTEVVMYKLIHPPKKNQLWYLDQTGCIRSALNDMVFHAHAKVDILKMEPPSNDSRSQWRFSGSAIVNGVGEALDVKGGSKFDGANLCAFDNKNQENQRWRLQREFIVVSEMNGKVLDVKRANTKPGTDVIMFHKGTPPKSNQLWYFDAAGFIRSALNDMGFGAAKGHDLKTGPVSEDPRFQWKFDGVKIVNGLKECLDIRGGSTSDGADVIAFDYSNSKNQHWRYEYV